MKTRNMNKSYLDKVLRHEITDHLYHLGVSSDDAVLDRMKGIRAVVMAGSGHRVRRMAQTWSSKRRSRDLFKFPKDERFDIFYSDGVLFCSHGMGMPSMSIALQELMKLVYYLKGGDLKEIDRVMWFRIGTSGGLTEPGNVVITTQALCSDFKPYRLIAKGKEMVFNTAFPKKFIDQIAKASKKEKFKVLKGKTVGGDCFYVEQNRLDGAVVLCSEKEKMGWLKKAAKKGVKNIEMESPVMAGFLNHWGFSRFAVICCVLVNRLRGDQIRSTKEQLEAYSNNAEEVLWNYLGSVI